MAPLLQYVPHSPATVHDIVTRAKVTHTLPSFMRSSLMRCRGEVAPPPSHPRKTPSLTLSRPLSRL